MHQTQTQHQQQARYGRERGGARTAGPGRPGRAQHLDAVGRHEHRLRARVAANTLGVSARPRVSDR